MKVLGKKYKYYVNSVINDKFPYIEKISDKFIERAKFWNWSVTCPETGEALFIDKKVKYKNTEIRKGSEITIERWDGNGIHDTVKVEKIVDGIIICDEGIIPEWGSNFIWKGDKGKDKYYTKNHCSINWENYWMKI